MSCNEPKQKSDRMYNYNDLSASGKSAQKMDFFLRAYKSKSIDIKTLLQEFGVDTECSCGFEPPSLKIGSESAEAAQREHNQRRARLINIMSSVGAEAFQSGREHRYRKEGKLLSVMCDGKRIPPGEDMKFAGLDLAKIASVKKKKYQSMSEAMSEKAKELLNEKNAAEAKVLFDKLPGMFGIGMGVHHEHTHAQCYLSDRNHMTQPGLSRKERFIQLFRRGRALISRYVRLEK